MKPRKFVKNVLVFSVFAAPAAIAIYEARKYRIELDDLHATRVGVPDELMDQIRRGDTLYFKINDAGEEIIYAPVTK